MTARYEERHRELREAAESTTRKSIIVPTEEHNRLRELDWRCGPLVDELVAAVRELTAGGVLPINSVVPARYTAVVQRLAALDEAAGND